MVQSLRDSMKLMRLHAGNEGFDDGMLLGWHGASDEAISNIIEKGFNPFCAGMGSGSMFGRGIYLAENSSKADLYAGPHPHKVHRGKMSVILAVAYCGNMYEAKTRGNWTEPPAPTAAQMQETGINR